MVDEQAKGNSACSSPLLKLMPRAILPFVGCIFFGMRFMFSNNLITWNMIILFRCIHAVSVFFTHLNTSLS